MRPSRVPPSLAYCSLSPTVGHGEDVLGPGLGPAHWPSDPTGVPTEGELFGVRPRLGAEATADVGHDHPYLQRIEAVDLGQQLLGRMGALAGRVVDEAAVGPQRRTRAAFDRRRRQALVDDALGHDDLAAAEVGGCRGGEAHDDVRAVLGEQEHVVTQRRFGIDDRGECFVVDDHEVGGVGAGRPVLGDHGGDGLTDVAHRVCGEERPAHHVGKGGVGVRGEAEVGDVVAGEDGDDAGGGRSLGGVDVHDAGVGVR